MDEPTSTNDVLPVGNWAGVRIAVAPTDAVTAVVDLAAAGVFTREMGADGPVGGLRHLNIAMGGAVLRLREDRVFTAAPGEILALSVPGPPVNANTVLLVGLGDPTDWSPAVLDTAVQAVTGEALRRGAASAAFAPSLLDSGLTVADGLAVTAAMLRGLTSALTAYGADQIDLRLWVFCTGAAHLDATHAAFRQAYIGLSHP